MSVFFWIEMARSLDSDGLEMFEESFIHFQAIRIETPGHLDPIKNRHRSRPGDCIQITFRKRGNPWFHRATFTYKMFAEVEVKRTVRLATNKIVRESALSILISIWHQEPDHDGSH